MIRMAFKGCFLAAALFLLLFLSPIVQGGENGPEKMVLDGGETGQVPFDHKKHQIALEDCMVCHALFPQTPNAIQESILQGALKSKQVMNTLCTSCHREKKKAGLSTGPVTCSHCHVRVKE